MVETLNNQDRAREVAERAASEYGLELVHVEMARTSGRGETVIRIFIDKPDGVTHEDCAHVSQYVDAVLEAEDFLRLAYILEVSSPGLERGLYKQADYERFAGHLAIIKTAKHVGNQKNFRGRILGFEADAVTFEDRTNGRVSIPFAAIQKANLEIDTEAEFRRAKELSERRSNNGGGSSSNNAPTAADVEVSE